MQGRRVPSTKRQTRSKIADLVVHRFLGVSLSGGKTDKTCAVVLEYYPEHGRLFLSQIHEKLKSEKNMSSDFLLYQLVTSTYKAIENVAINAPLSFPLCMTCELDCPGFESCKEDHITWMWKNYRKIRSKKKNHRLFTPYTQRAVEMYLGSEFETPFHPDDAFGSNLAPISSRAQFLQNRLEEPLLEVNTKMSVWSLGTKYRVAKSHIKNFAHAIHGADSRRGFVSQLEERKSLFLYKQDVEKLADNLYAFEALINGLTGYLFFIGECLPRPKGFPTDEAWIALPDTK